MDINALVNYLAYFAWIVDAGGIIASAALVALGKEEGKKILFGTIAGAFVLTFFWTILTSTIPAQNVNLPYWNYVQEYAYAGAAIATIFAAIEMIRGELREGLGYLLGAILIVFMINFGPSILGVQSLNLQPANINAEIGGVGVSGINFGGIPISWLIEMPNPSSFSAFDSVFKLAQNVALGILGIAFVFALIIRTYEQEDFFTALKQTSKDTIVAAILIYWVVDLYNIFSQVINYAATNILYPYQGPLESIDNIVSGVIVGGFIGGYFVPALADIASNLLFSLFLASMLALIRFLAIASALAVSPILFALWIVPPLRGVIRFIMDVVIGLGISGLIASVILALLSSFIQQYPAILLASPVLFGFLPMLIGFGATTGLLPVGAGNIIPFKFKRGGGNRQSGGAPSGTAIAEGAAAGAVAGAAVGEAKLRAPALATAGQTKLTRQTILRHSGTAEVVSQVTPPPAPTGLIGRVRNRYRETTVLSSEDQFEAPRGYRIKNVEEVKDYGPIVVAPVGKNLRITPSDMSNVSAMSSLRTEKQGGIIVFPGTATDLRKKRIEAEETKVHALVSGALGNLKAGTTMTLEKFGQRVDNWLASHGVSFRPAETTEQIVKEVKLRRAKTKKPKSF